LIVSSNTVRTWSATDFSLSSSAPDNVTGDWELQVFYLNDFFYSRFFLASFRPSPQTPGSTPADTPVCSGTRLKSLFESIHTGSKFLSSSTPTLAQTVCRC
jgi:hypothetical protein